MERLCRLTAVAAAMAVGCTAALAGRYEGYTQQFAKGPHAKVLAATFFGGAGNEEFVAAAAMADGTIVAFGNAYGPKFADVAAVKVVGKGTHQGLKSTAADKKGQPVLRGEDPDAAGTIVFFDRDMTKVLRAVRFDWGVASISTAAVARDGKAFILAGRCGPQFASLGSRIKVKKLVPQPAEETGGRRRRAGMFGPYEFDSAKVDGHVYVMRISPTGDAIDWAWVFQGHRRPAETLWQDNAANVYAELNGLSRIAADGGQMVKLTSKGFGGHPGVLAVNPADGGFIYGGDRNTNTGRQPWRSPYLYCFDRTGAKLWKLWEWTPRLCACGGGGNGLCSDSSPRSADYDRNGDMIVGGWSDGGNSVFTRQPGDLDKPAPIKGLGMSSWGMRSANSLGYILRIDPVTKQQKSATMWLAYVPEDFSDAKYRGAPNFANVEEIRVLEGGAVAFRGSGASGIVQTPNAFYRYPHDGKKHGGEVAAIVTGDFAHCLFSSYLPACHELRLGSAGKRLLVVSSSSGASDMGPAPTVNAIQKTKQGDFDAHIVMIEAP